MFDSSDPLCYDLRTETIVDTRGRLQALFDNAVDGVLFANDEGRFVDVNPAACALLERSRDELLALHAWDIVPAAASSLGQSLWADFLRRGTVEGSYPLVGCRGAVREVRCRAVANVVPRLHMAIVHDVTASNTIQRNDAGKLEKLNLQLRNLSARARARLESDRTRLAREIHDQLGQSLAALKIDLFWLRDRLAADRADDRLLAKIATMTALVDDTILGVRRIASELRPPVLDRLGLIAAIEWQVDDFQRRTAIRVVLRVKLDTVRLDTGRATAVFRIFQEILTNVATHSRAAEVTVRVSTARKTLRLVVDDDGCGMPPDAADSAESLGLLGMRERADLLGGSVTIQAATPRGTRVVVNIPLSDRRRPTRERP